MVASFIDSLLSPEGAPASLLVAANGRGRKLKLQMFMIGFRLRGVAQLLIWRDYVPFGPAAATATSTAD